jgi:hypothetical protein
MIGVRGSGKTMLVKKLESFIPIKLENYGVIDGDLIRANSNLSGRWNDNKTYTESIKNKILFDSINEKRNIILLDSAEKSEYYYDLFKNHHYKIIVVGVYVDNWKEVLTRGKYRNKTTGKTYTGTREM